MKRKPLKIAVVGEIRSGKDTVCNLIEDLHDKYFYKLYFAKGIEEIIKKYFPEAYEDGKKPRKHFQEIGQFFRKLNSEVWINYTKIIYTNINKEGFANFLVTDLRKLNEYEWLKSEGFTIVKVTCPEEIRLKRMKELNDTFDISALHHEAEQEINKVPYDYLIENSTTIEDLKYQVSNLLKELKGDK